jgi:hypothetical protein
MNLRIGSHRVFTSCCAMDTCLFLGAMVRAQELPWERSWACIDLY